jgi:hypothetical protein
MKIILANGVELTPIMVTGAPKYVQGATRDTLDFVFAGCSLDELKTHFTEKNCEVINIIGDDGSSAIHEGYVIRAELVERNVEIQKATVNDAAVYEDRIFVSMSQRTYAETKLAQIDDTALAVAELGVLLAGGME